NSAGAPLCQLGQAYVTAVQRAGGIPLVIPVSSEGSALASLLSRLDGVLLSGGGDIDPLLFNGAPHPKVYGISPERDAMEIALVRMALAVDKPLLAICRGIQVLNVALGGGLYTHIQDQVEHSLKHDWFPKFPRDKLAHTVSLTCESQLDQIYEADEIRVNSLHHQGISRVGEGLTATAFAPDGLVEGLEVKGSSFALGVQWHPECLPDDPGSQRLFGVFIRACL
ncbi:MAG: gamma-glutamyl-gamma-aminobutyrate hydrolase family protein, partial [Brevefilum sp.]|nr:gamma-glutamyl-gamma-aminobutyrate hydrolase family protein [Brevefilum sp.]